LQSQQKGRSAEQPLACTFAVANPVQTTPCCIIASATLLKPAMFAPIT
jgi:hypothetical protein